MLVLGLYISCHTTELCSAKNFSWDNQFEVVKEMICFQYPLNNKHLIVTMYDVQQQLNHTKEIHVLLLIKI